MTEFFELYANQIGASERMMVAIAMLLYSCIAGYHLIFTEMSMSLRMIVGGVTLAAVGWFLHRLYFSIFWYFRVTGDTETATWMLNNSIVTVIPMIMVVIGAVFTVIPACLPAQSTFSWRPYILGSIFAFGIWFFIFTKLLQSSI